MPPLHQQRRSNDRRREHRRSSQITFPRSDQSVGGPPDTGRRISMESDMPISAPSIDPLAHFIEAIIRRGSKQPIPLASTRIDVIIRGGLATVTTERTFRNTEKESIEATMTF